jgi:hypothetical protein
MSLRSCFSLAQPTAAQGAVQRPAFPDVSPAQRMDAHARGCVTCQAALDVPSPQADCVCRLCPDGLAFLIASLTPCGAMAARVEMGGAQ